MKNVVQLTHQKLRRQLKDIKPMLEFLFDGDADRIIMCDEKGKIVDGDQIIAMLAKRWKSKRILKGGGGRNFNVKLRFRKFFKL